MKNLFVLLFVLMMGLIYAQGTPSEDQILVAQQSRISAKKRSGSQPRDGLIYSRRTFSTSQIEKIVRRINYYRRSVSPTAADMILVTWDSELANLAAAHTRTCTWNTDGLIESEAHTEHGLNMVALLTLYNTLNPPSDLGELSVDDWADASHLLKEMTVAGMFEVGCGQTSCTRVDGGGSSQTITACFLAPASTSGSAAAYTPGESCTQCPQMYPRCYNKLCTDLQDAEAEQWNWAPGVKFTLALIVCNLVISVFMIAV